MSDMIKTIGILDHGPVQLQSERSHTCDRCLTAWPKIPFDEDNADIFKIEEKAEELLLSTCKVCQILGMAMQAYQNETPSLQGPFLLSWQRKFCYSGVVVFHDSNGIKRGEGSQPGIVKVRYSGTFRADSWWNHKILEGLHVDFGAVKSWLEKCDSHIQCTSGIQQGLQNLKVIDCMERAVVSAPIDCQYVALSYVWGGLVFEAESTSGLLPTILPRTIEDGIKATLSLGYRYLWVDAFCIKQDDSEDKHRQIQQMDLIYNSAMLTLIAAAGSNPSYGLPGVSNARKVRDQDASIRNVWVSFTPETVYRAVAASPWFTRGWTFQEGYVSRRRLYFTESGILFICNKTEKHEGLRREDTSSDISTLEGTLRSRALWSVGHEFSGVIEIMRLLKQYMRRQLSYENDILNAILGVLNYHYARNPSIGTICGLPYQISVAGPEIICLNWTHNRPATRRLGYPSWSPFGWIGSIEFSPISRQLRPSKKDAASFSCHVRDGCADWNHLETSQYLQITANLHYLPLVNLVRSDSNDMKGRLSEHPKTMVVVPVGGTEFNYDAFNSYFYIKWDVTPPNHYNSTWVTCAYFWSSEAFNGWLMILQDYGTHYERIGSALLRYPGHYTNTTRVARFDELASTTNGLPTLRPKESPGFYREYDRKQTYLFWLRAAREVTITLG